MLVVGQALQEWFFMQSDANYPLICVCRCHLRVFDLLSVASARSNGVQRWQQHHLCHMLCHRWDAVAESDMCLRRRHMLHSNNSRYALHADLRKHKSFY